MTYLRPHGHRCLCGLCGDGGGDAPRSGRRHSRPLQVRHEPLLCSHALGYERFSIRLGHRTCMRMWVSPTGSPPRVVKWRSKRGGSKQRDAGGDTRYHTHVSMRWTVRNCQSLHDGGRNPQNPNKKGLLSRSPRACVRYVRPDITGCVFAEGCERAVPAWWRCRTQLNCQRSNASGHSSTGGVSARQWRSRECRNFQYSSQRNVSSAGVVPCRPAAAAATANSAPSARTSRSYRATCGRLGGLSNDARPL